MLFRTADKASIDRFEQWYESLNPSLQEQLRRRLFRSNFPAGNEALFTAFIVFDEKDFNFPPPVNQTMDLALLLKGSVASHKLFTELPKDHQIAIRRESSKLGQRYFTAYLMALKIAGNPKPAMISQDHTRKLLKLTDEEIPESMGSREFLNTTQQYRTKFMYKGVESLLLLLRSIYGESNTIDLAQRLIIENRSVDAQTLMSLLQTWDDVKHLPIDWALSLIPESTDDDNS